MGCCGPSNRNDEYKERGDARTGSSNDEALRILGVRLAKGEITKQEYADLKEAIEKEGSIGTRAASRTNAAQSEDQSGRKKRWFSGGGC